MKNTVPNGTHNRINMLFRLTLRDYPHLRRFLESANPEVLDELGRLTKDLEDEMVGREKKGARQFWRHPFE